MPRSTILVIGGTDDPHITQVSGSVEELGGRVFLIDPHRNQPSSFSLRFDHRGGAISLRGKGAIISGDEISAVWWRLKPPFDIPSLPDEAERINRTFALREWRHALESLELILEGAFWLNPRRIDRAIRHKPFQLLKAVQAGFAIPATIISNDAEEVGSFLETYSSDCIYKPLSYYYAPGRLLFTNTVAEKQIVSDRLSIQVAPGIFQPRLKKAHELRITIVGVKVFSVRIDSQKQTASALDWRRVQKDVAYVPEALPPSFESKLLAFHRDLGLVFGAYDFIVTDDGHFIFLEVNPVGQWLWIEELTGIPISAAVAKLLSTPAAETKSQTTLE